MIKGNRGQILRYWTVWNLLYATHTNFMKTNRTVRERTGETIKTILQKKVVKEVSRKKEDFPWHFCGIVCKLVSRFAVPKDADVSQTKQFEPIISVISETSPR